MSRLEKLKSAISLHDIARLLGFKPKALSYILYKKPPESKYSDFEIPKRSGGVRQIRAPYPDLMNLQRRLSRLLQDCIAEINAEQKTGSALAHGFRRKHSIITNAYVHRRRRHVLNIDLENFFGTINFGRVRGFFIRNRHFALDPKVATILAQIVCFDHVLPQGSPCSPVISNLIGHLLDIRLAALAYQNGCSYSRYADDITFSTNKCDFPTKLAKPSDGEEHHWEVGTALSRAIAKAGFKINSAKTRMQYKTSRQEVTGLVVNAKVNTRTEYRHTSRAMVHNLLTKGEFFTKHVAHDDSGKTTVTTLPGTIEELNGLLSFVDSVGVYNRRKVMKPSEQARPLPPPEKLNSNEKTYRRFLFYKHFFAISKPTIVFEGKTDTVYIRGAIRRLAVDYPKLVDLNGESGPNIRVGFFRRTTTTDRILKISGGTHPLKTLIQDFIAERKQLHIATQAQPLIIMIDNDDGSKIIYSYLKEIMKTQIDPKLPYFLVHDGLYVIPTPLTTDNQHTKIEDFLKSRC